MPVPSFNRSRDRGFTLVELLVVIGVISVMAAAAVPNIYGYLRATRIRTAHDEVFNAVQKARLSAITRNTQYGVSFIVESQSVFWIHIEDPMIAVGADAGTTGRQALDNAAPDLNYSTRFELTPPVVLAIAANTCPGFAAAGNQASLRFDRYGVRYFPGTSPTVSDPAVPALAGTPTVANAIVRTNSSAEASLCLVDTETGLSRRVLIAPGGRVKKG